MNNLMGSLTDAVSRLYQILADVESGKSKGIIHLILYNNIRNH